MVELPRQQVQHVGRHARLVALEVDEVVCLLPVAPPYLETPLRAVAACGRGHLDLRAQRGHAGMYQLAIGRHHHARGPIPRAGIAPRVPQEGFASHIQEGFAGQPRGVHTGWQDNETVAFRHRGMPSFTVPTRRLAD